MIIYHEEVNSVQIKASKHALELRTANSMILIAPDDIDETIEKMREAQRLIKERRMRDNYDRN
jgi:hypothetical protein